MTSANFVPIPSRPDTHIQKTAPGPPEAIAVATPAMLPTPTVPPMATETAWKGVTSPSAPGARRNALPSVSRHIRPKRTNWMNRVRKARKTPTPTSAIHTPASMLPFSNVSHSISGPLS